MACTAKELGAAYLALGCAARDVEREVYGVLVLGCAPRSLSGAHQRRPQCRPHSGHSPILHARADHRQLRLRQNRKSRRPPPPPRICAPITHA